MAPSEEPHTYEGELELGRNLFKFTQEHALYDEIGDQTSFGWYGLIIYNRIPYIVCYNKGVFKYKPYDSQKAASKAWDHVCNKFERWFVEQYE